MAYGDNEIDLACLTTEYPALQNTVDGLNYDKKSQCPKF